MTCTQCELNKPIYPNKHSKECIDFAPEPLVLTPPCDPVLFHKSMFEASQGTDELGKPDYVSPADLNYKNVLLQFEATGHVYLYSSDGIPTLIPYAPINIDALVEQLNQETIARENGDQLLQEAIDTLGKTPVQKDTTLSADSSTVTLTKIIGELSGDGLPTGVPFPVASTTQAGVMNAATFKSVQDNSENIDSILNGAVALNDISKEVTQDELTQLWEEATGKTSLINRASIYDIDNGILWTYYTNVSQWLVADIKNPEINIAIATNTTTGIVKGSDEIFVEPDGSLSVIGLDGIKHDLENLTELVQSIDTPKLYSTWGTNADGALTQQFLDGVLNSSYLHLGQDSYLGYNFSTVIVPTGAQHNYRLFQDVVIGSNSKIGELPNTESAYQYAVAIGSGATANADRSIALGAGSLSTREYELSLGGNPSAVHPTCYVAHVTAGERDDDAVNLKQMKDYVAENANGTDSRLTDTGASRANNLPLQVFYTTSPTAYNPSDIEIHLLQKDLSTGGDATIPFTINGATNALAGVMTSSHVAQLDTNTETIAEVEATATSLLNSATSVTGLGAEPTQEEITTAWETATLQTELINGATLYDADNKIMWVYFASTATWANTSASVEVLGAYADTPTDAQVYNAAYINTTVGNINTLLETLISGGGAS